MAHIIDGLVLNGQPYEFAATDTNLAGTETDPSAASKAYVVGEHLIMDGQYYVVIAPIAENDGLVVDTNISVATVGNEIKQHGTEISQTNANLAAISSNLTANNATAGVENVAFRFGIDDNGNYGYYKDGADTVTPFSKGAQLVGNYSANANIDVTSYNPKSADEFFIVPRGNASTSGGFSTWNYGGTVSVSGSFSMGSKSLNGNTLSVTAPKISVSGSLPNVDSWSGSKVVPYSVYFVASV